MVNSAYDFTSGRHENDLSILSDYFPTLQGILHLAGNFLKIPVIDDDRVRPPLFFFDRHLHFFTAMKLGFIPSTQVLESRSTQFERGIDKNNFVAILMPAGLQHDSSIQNDELQVR